MCSHEWITMNDVTACKRCGLTRLPDGRIMFDKQFANVGKKVKNKKRRNSNAKTGK